MGRVQALMRGTIVALVLTVSAGRLRRRRRRRQGAATPKGFQSTKTDDFSVALPSGWKVDQNERAGRPGPVRRGAPAGHRHQPRPAARRLRAQLQVRHQRRGAPGRGRDPGPASRRHARREQADRRPRRGRCPAGRVDGARRRRDRAGADRHRARAELRQDAREPEHGRVREPGRRRRASTTSCARCGSGSDERPRQPPACSARPATAAGCCAASAPAPARWSPPSSSRWSSSPR